MSSGQDQANDQEIERRLTSNTVTSHTEEPGKVGTRGDGNDGQSFQTNVKTNKTTVHVQSSSNGGGEGGNTKGYSSTTSKYLSNKRNTRNLEARRAAPPQKSNVTNVQSNPNIASTGNLQQGGNKKLSQAQLHRANAINNVQRMSQSGVHVTPGRRFETNTGYTSFRSTNPHLTSGQTYVTRNSYTYSPRTSTGGLK